MFSSIVGSHVELDPWRKEHSAYPEAISTCVMNLSADFLYAHIPVILALLLLEESVSLKSLPSLMLLQTRENHECKTPRKPN